MLDPFAGSGITFLAEQTDRKALLMELDPYCDVIVQRWEKFTGKQAERKDVTATCGQTAGSATPIDER